MTYQHILYEVSDKIATITLNRPDRMNAWTATMERDVRHAMEAASADDNVRVIVLTGAGRAFCAGADMDALKGLDPSDIRRAENIPPFDMNRRPDLQTRYAYYPSIPKPVIGMLNGATAGIGLVHALYCDLRFAADNTVFTTAFARRGLIAEYRESVNGGVAMAQLGVEPARMGKVFQRWTGWLKERPETLAYLARPKGSRAQRQ